jgi:hypothetical protein
MRPTYTARVSFKARVPANVRYLSRGLTDPDRWIKAELSLEMMKTLEANIPMIPMTESYADLRDSMQRVPR